MTAPRKPPFALWVQNVDPERVDAKDLWEAFARYGDMCKPREHGARAVEILPESKAAIVNFASYDHACAALRGLQGALIGRITRPGLAIAWHKRQEEPPQKQQPVPHPEKTAKERPPFFGLWVGNVHASLVHEEEFRAAFERYGELCNPTIHSVPPVNILPESSSAFVNFAAYEHANAVQTRNPKPESRNPKPWLRALVISFISFVPAILTFPPSLLPSFFATSLFLFHLSCPVLAPSQVFLAFLPCTQPIPIPAFLVSLAIFLPSFLDPRLACSHFWLLSFLAASLPPSLLPAVRASIPSVLPFLPCCPSLLASQPLFLASQTRS